MSAGPPSGMCSTRTKPWSRFPQEETPFDKTPRSSTKNIVPTTKVVWFLGPNLDKLRVCPTQETSGNLRQLSILLRAHPSTGMWGSGQPRGIPLRNNSCDFWCLDPAWGYAVEPLVLGKTTATLLAPWYSRKWHATSPFVVSWECQSLWSKWEWLRDLRGCVGQKKHLYKMSRNTVRKKQPSIVPPECNFHVGCDWMPTTLEELQFNKRWEMANLNPSQLCSRIWGSTFTKSPKAVPTATVTVFGLRHLASRFTPNVFFRRILLKWLKCDMELPRGRLAHWILSPIGEKAPQSAEFPLNGTLYSECIVNLYLGNDGWYTSTPNES